MGNSNCNASNNDHCGNTSNNKDIKYTECAYLNCENKGKVFMKESKYVKQGMYCNKHVDYIDTAIIDNLVEQFVIDWSNIKDDEEIEFPLICDNNVSQISKIKEYNTDLLTGHVNNNIEFKNRIYKDLIKLD